MSNTISYTTHAVPMSQMIKIVSQKQGDITLPIESGVSLSHIRAGNSGATRGGEVNLSRAIALNNIISKLTSMQKNQLASMYDDFKAGNIKRSELVSALRDITQQNNNNDFTLTIESKGLFVNRSA